MFFREWSAAARCTAAHHLVHGESYGRQLSLARACVYAAAADLVDELGERAAVAEMLTRASRLRVLTPPMAGFDPAGLRYIEARGWQFCAQHIDPGVPVVQPPWD